MFALPIDDFIERIIEVVRDKSQVILMASPGAGKTTRLPPQLLSAVKGKIAVLEPRRLAAVAASQFIADENGWRLGQQVGYQVRLESQLTDSTRLIFMTDAILLRHLVNDPSLVEFDLIVIDEFHERNLNQELVLGLLKELQMMGRDIKILIMSATLNHSRLQDYLPESEVIEVPGKAFPLDIEYSSFQQSLETDHVFIKRVVDAVIAADKQAAGDILVFLPGVGEIRRVEGGLRERKFCRLTVQLHGSLKLEEQRSILKRHTEKRVILSTNVAEASVTVPGVNYVIDAGLVRIQTVNLSSGFLRLGLTKVARFNATQRAGRAAREMPGTCLRLWTLFDEASQEKEMVPESQRTDLTSALLYLAHLGIRDFKNFSWFDTPPEALIRKALVDLRNLNAIKGDGSLSENGRALLRYPVATRWGVLLEQSRRRGWGSLGAQIVAVLEERDIVAEERVNNGEFECDLMPKLKHFKGNIIFYRQLLQLVEAQENFDFKREDLKVLLLCSQSDRLCRRRGKSEKGVMVGGRGVKLAKQSQVKNSEFFIALSGIDLANSAETLVSTASGFDKEDLLNILANQMSENKSIVYDEKCGQFMNRKVRMIHDLEIDEPQLTPVAKEDLGDRFIDFLQTRWEEVLSGNAALFEWNQRWIFFIHKDLEMQENFKIILHQVLQLAAPSLKSFKDAMTFDFVSYIEGLLDHSKLKQFHDLCPSHFLAPSGNSHKIHYEMSNEVPQASVEIRLQEVFGLNVTPLIGLQKQPLVFKLLAPNFRPTQVTSDIAGFWKNTYFEVRKELRARYPKHSWPEDPLSAEPMAKGRRTK